MNPPKVNVNSFITEDGIGWNIDKLREWIVAEDVEKILRIKISAKAKLDLLGRHYNEDGLYTVKSGYWLSTHIPGNEEIFPIYGNVEVKSKIWKCSSPPKIKYFLWKLMSQSLATGSNLKRRHISPDDQCRHCCGAEETEKHLFFECPYAQVIWRASGVSNTIINNPLATLEEKL